MNTISEQKSIQALQNTIPAGIKGIPKKEAMEMMMAEGNEVEYIIESAKNVRKSVFGNRVRLCSIVNAKSGRCPEYCSFCSQSKFFKTGAPVFPLKSPEEILSSALISEKNNAYCFSIVTSGRKIRSGKELSTIEKAIKLIKSKTSLKRCASLGELTIEQLIMLKEAGLEHYHHNIETASSMHPQIVKTHTYLDEVKAVERAKQAKLAVCSGGILGMGESIQQRVDFLFELRDIDPDFIPLNFLNPIEGTPLMRINDLTPVECLKIIAITRLVLPDKHIVICGGREKNLQDLQFRIFDAGATGIIIGDYLTTRGQSAKEDIEMIEKAGYKIEKASDRNPSE